MPELLPAPVLAPVAPALVCGATGCAATPLAQWARRLTSDELTVELAIIQARWDTAYLLRDQSLPDPIQPPLPDGSDYTRAVYACGPHAIGLDAASQIHEATCSAPHSVPYQEACDCTPEPLPTPPAEIAPVVPEHWATAMAGGA